MVEGGVVYNDIYVNMHADSTYLSFGYHLYIEKLLLNWLISYGNLPRIAYNPKPVPITPKKSSPIPNPIS
jgi:hypothetical protein